jgi:hypothetical protein
LFRHVPLRPELVALMRREAAALGGSAADVIDLWERMLKDLRQQLAAGDPAEFLHWPVVEQTMVIRRHRRVAGALAHLRARQDWRRRWRPAVREATLGQPRPLPRCPWSSANAVFQAYHACRFEEVTARALASLPLIVEFGGGYGRFCQLVHDLGFRGTYVIFDLPEVAVLQRFYLHHVGIPVSEAGSPTPGVVTVANVSALKTLLRARPQDEAAFVAIGSLSETPLALRETLLGEVASFDAFLIFYSAQHDALDNRAYFTRWRTALPGHAWRDVETPHFGKSSAYLFGYRATARGSG